MVRNRNTEAVREIEVVEVRHTSPIWSELNETGNFNWTTECVLPI